MTSATARDFDRALQAAADGVLRAAVERENGVPGVVAMVTDRTQTRYAGAAGRRGLERETPMTNDTHITERPMNSDTRAPKMRRDSIS